MCPLIHFTQFFDKKKTSKSQKANQKNEINIDLWEHKQIESVAGI